MQWARQQEQSSMLGNKKPILFYSILFGGRYSAIFLKFWLSRFFFPECPQMRGKMRSIRLLGTHTQT
jgi:hypothetical protein